MEEVKVQKEKQVFIKAKETPDGLIAKFRRGDEYFYKTIDYQNFIYIKADSLDERGVRKKLQEFSDKAHEFNATNGKFIKIYLKNNFDRYKLKNQLEAYCKIKTYEGDINSVKHWLIDNPDLELNSKDLRVTYYDIETDDRGEFLKEKDGTVIAHSPVMSCATCSENEDEDAEFFINEEVGDVGCEVELLKQIGRKFEKSDIVTAWNGMKFDEPFLKQREEGIREMYPNVKPLIPWKLVNRFDEMVKFKKSNGAGFKSYSLNNVSRIVLKDEKIGLGEFSGGNGGFYNVWKENKKLLEEYNKQDVLLMRRLEYATNNYQVHKVCSDLCHCPIEDTMFNSMMSDYLMLNRYARRFIIAPSKPGFQEKEARFLKGGISGGYTFCFIPGFHKNVTVVDYKSHYPLCMLTFNISPDTFLFNFPIDFDEMIDKMDKDKINYMIFADKTSRICKNDAGKFVGSKFKKLDAEYRKAHNIDFDLVELMYEFTDKYMSEKASEHAKKHNLVFTPADFNLDTNGWHFHPHRMFSRDEIGVVPDLQQYVLDERDRSKYLLKTMIKEKGGEVKSTDEFKQVFTQQIAIKTVGNATFGFLGYPGSRFYEWDVGDSITTSARWIMKKSIIFARNQNWTITNGDTDSVFIMNADGSEIPRQEINIKYYNYYKEMFAGFNCNYNKEVKNPETGEMETNPYYCVFEHEHTYRKLIVVAKKRYYFLEEFKDGEGNITSTVNTMGGAFKKRDTNPLAAKLQKELCADILNEVYDRNKWVKIMMETKEQCYGNKLPVDLLTYSKTYPKHWSEYGQPTIDGKTGLPKKKADGSQQFAPVSAHIQMVKRLEEAGQSFQIGDAVKYIVADPEIIDLKPISVKNKDKDDFYDTISNIINEKTNEPWIGAYVETEVGPDATKEEIKAARLERNRNLAKARQEMTEFCLKHVGITETLKYFEEFNIPYKVIKDHRQRAISVDEYKAGAKYNQDAYYARIISPMIEILNVCDKDAITKEYKNCWNFTEKQLQKLIDEELKDEEEKNDY